MDKGRTKGARPHFRKPDCGLTSMGRLKGLRILLVDDDPGLRTLLRTTFEVADIEVDEARMPPWRCGGSTDGALT